MKKGILFVATIILVGYLSYPKGEPVGQAVIEPMGELAVKESVGTTTKETKVKLDDTLATRTASEKADLKSLEIVKTKTSPKELKTFNQTTYEIEITDIQKIEGGVSVYARAWDINGNPIGFGPDGSVEIERFNIYNPPILVDDPLGDITRTWTNERTGLIEVRTLREDPLEAVKQTLIHNISIVGKDGSKIEPGKVGRTTSTFYPDANPESTSVDGLIKEGGSTILSWANIRAETTAATALPSIASAEFAGAYGYTTSGNWNELYRSAFLFNTSAIGDTDTISSATFSVYVTSKADPHSEMSFGVGTSSPASTTDLTTTDFGLGTRFGTTALASDIAYASISTSAFNDWTLNATGIANVSLTGISKFGLLSSQDRDNSSPTWAASTYKHITGYYADQTGTTNDPKLVVEHTSPGGGGSTVPAQVILFE